MKLSINIDHVATLREARGGLEPDPVTAAHLCEIAGAHGIVCHLREDRRHINDRDLRLLRDTVKTRLDLEMAATDEIVAVAIDTLPELATLVPERRQELTTEGGLDVRGNRHRLRDVVARLQDHESPSGAD
jgi:pyridoxine 5-phosphate synthase